jgi:hypothetical protein
VNFVIHEKYFEEPFLCQQERQMEDIHLPTLAWLWDEDWHIEMDFKAGFQFSFTKWFDLVRFRYKVRIRVMVQNLD